MLTDVLFLGTTDEGFVDEAPATRALHMVGQLKAVSPPEPTSAADRTFQRTADHTAEIPRVNPAAVSFFDQDPWEPLDLDEPSLRPRGQKAIVAIASLLTFIALGYGAFLLATQGSTDEVGELAAAELAANVAPDEEPPAPEPLPELRPFDVDLTDKTIASVKYAGQDILTVTTAKGSRYDTVEQRAKAVSVRLEHIAMKQRESRDASARFIARVNGDRYEVVWDDGSAHPFRITDVTKHDLAKDGDLAIEANLQADALTDLFRRSIAPVTLPTS